MGNDIKFFVINLSRDIEKKRHMIELFDAYDSDITIIEAIDGKLLSQEEISKIYAYEKSIDVLGRELTKGEIACLLSHQKIYKKIIDENIQEAIILEDDVTFDKNLFKVLEKKEKFPRNSDLILLGYWRVGIGNIKNLISFWCQHAFASHYKIVRFTTNIHGAYGYYITYTGAKKLLDKLNPNIFLPIDHYTGDDKYINLYGIYPPVVFLSEKFDLNTNMEKERVEQRAKKKKKSRFLKTTTVLKKIGLYLLVRKVISSLHKVKVYLRRFKILKRYI